MKHFITPFHLGRAQFGGKLGSQGFIREGRRIFPFAQCICNKQMNDQLGSDEDTFRRTTNQSMCVWQVGYWILEHVPRQRVFLSDENASHTAYVKPLSELRYKWKTYTKITSITMYVSVHCTARLYRPLSWLYWRFSIP